MKKKTEVIEILNQGGRIMVDTIYRTARVYTAAEWESDSSGDSCRYDVAESLTKTAGYKKVKTDWYASYHIVKETAAEPEKTAAEWEAESERVHEEESAWCAQVFGAAEEAAPAVEEEEPEETAQEKTDRENWEHCKSIAETLEAYAAGNVFKCPECGEDVEITSEDDGDSFKCESCGHVATIEEFEQMSLYDYFSDCYDIEYRCGSEKEYRSCQVMIACGGPNIYIDTAEKAVLLYWWTDRARYHLSSEAVEAVDDWAREHWDCL